MTNSISFDSGVCSRPVLTASTGASFDSGTDGPRLPSLVFDSLGPRPAADLRAAMQLTERDCAIIELVGRARALRADQIQIALFTPGGTSRCQRRLTLLFRNRYVDRLPRRTANEPAVYLLTRRSVQGNRLLRSRWGETVLRQHMTKIGSLAHLLGVNEVRVRVERACKDLGWDVPRWRRSDDLVQRAPETRLVPDAYFRIHRPGDAQAMTGFLELERASKSLQALRSKLLRYADLYYRQRDQQRAHSLRVLFVFDQPYHGNRSHRVEASAKEALRLGVTFARFVDMEQLQQLPAVACLTEAVWLAPGRDAPVPLFPTV